MIGNGSDVHVAALRGQYLSVFYEASAGDLPGLRHHSERIPNPTFWRFLITS